MGRIFFCAAIFLKKNVVPAVLFIGKPLVFTYKGQEAKLCCKSCKKDFDKTPDKFIAKIRNADNKPQN